MRVRDYFVLAQSLPPRRIVQKGIKRIWRRVKEYFRKRRDFKGSTYVFPISYKIEKLYGYFGQPPLRYLQTKANEIVGVAEHYLEHRFDLLGSGWVQVKHGMICGGIEGYRYQMGMKVLADQEGQWLKGRVNSSNLKMSEQIWQLVDPDYVPIDWHLDFKSGYRWSEDTWYRRIPYGHKPGVDIKVPWELARMQHLPQLVWAYALAKKGQIGFQPSQVYVRKFRNQILDFIATNPPRFGVNWRSTMDVAIRIANWLVTYDLFRACGAVFDDSFETTFFHSIYQHGEHIVNNLEWDERFRGNHYLSNVVGLLFVASYLPCSPETDTWLALAIQELVHEVGHQFNKDGGNFEASTSYHRLSAEMAVYGTALTLGLPYEKRSALEKYDCHLLKGGPKLRPGPVTLHPLTGGERFNPFPLWYIEKLEKMAEFTMHLTKPNGHIPQIGDNDSGRFFKFQPLFHLMKVDETGAQSINLNNSIALSDTGHYWDEDHLDHRHLLAAINGLFGREDFTEFTCSGWIETEIVKQMAKGVLLPSYKGSDEPTAAEQKYIHESEERGRICGGNASQPVGKVFSKKNETLSGNKLYAYPEFGMFIFKSKYIYLAIRCGPNGQNGNGGHAHNDNLSFELNVRGRDFIIDGGSYLYTPFPNIRNVFRSTRAHNTLILNGLEQNEWADGLVGLFSMRDDAHARILKLGIQSLMGEHYGFGSIHRREFNVDGSSLVFEDILDTNQPSEIILNLAPEVEILCLEKHGSEEFFLEMSSADLHVKALFKWFKGAEIVDGYFSRGYGKRVKNLLVKGHRLKSLTRVEFDFGEDDG
jgi:hypothetical protein